MSSTKEDGTAVAGEQLGSMSEPENNEDAENNTRSGNRTTPTKMCSACRKKSDGRQARSPRRGVGYWASWGSAPAGGVSHLHASVAVS